MGRKHPLLAQEKIWNDTEAGSKFKPHPFHWCFLLFSLVNCRRFLLQGLGCFSPCYSTTTVITDFPLPGFPYALLIRCMQNTECRRWRGVKHGIAVLCPAASSGSGSRSFGLYKGQRKWVAWIPERCKANQTAHQSHCRQRHCRYCVFNGRYLIVLRCCLCMLRDLH